MSISVKHAFASAKADGVDTTLVQPSNWNAEHTITLAASKILGRDSSGAGAMQELPMSFSPAGNATIPGALTVTGVFTASGTGYVSIPSGTTAERPGSPARGMVRYNSTLEALEYYNGTTWSQSGSGGSSVTISDSAPGAPTAGDLWWNSYDGQLYVYYNDGSSYAWIVVANAASQSTNPQYSYVNAAVNAQGNVTYTTSTASAGFTATLPAAASVSTGFTITFIDVGGSQTTNNLTISGNGSNINFMGLGAAATLTVDTNYAAIILVWDGTVWKGVGYA